MDEDKFVERYATDIKSIISNYQQNDGKSTMI